MKLLGFMLVLACFSAPLYGKVPAAAPLHLRLADAMGLRSSSAIAAVAELEGIVRLWRGVVTNQEGYQQFRGSLDELFAAAGDNGRDLQRELSRAVKGEQGGVQTSVDALLRLDEGELTLLLRTAVRDLKLIELLASLVDASQFLDQEVEHEKVNTILEELDVGKTAAAIETWLETLGDFELRLAARDFYSIHGKIKELKELAKDDKLTEDFLLLVARSSEHLEEQEELPSFVSKELLLTKITQFLAVVSRDDHPKLLGIITKLRDMQSSY